MYFLYFPKLLIFVKEKSVVGFFGVLGFFLVFILLKNGYIKIEDTIILTMPTAFKVPGSVHDEC